MGLKFVPKALTFKQKLGRLSDKFKLLLFFVQGLAQANFSGNQLFPGAVSISQLFSALGPLLQQWLFPSKKEQRMARLVSGGVGFFVCLVNPLYTR